MKLHAARRDPATVAPAHAASTSIHGGAVQEHEHEAVPGLPEPLPQGEKLLWQGEPDWRWLARRAFHVRKLAVYFSLLVAWRLGSTLADGGGAAAMARDLAVMLPLVALGSGLAYLLAWLSARSTLYTITDQRVVMRLGIVLTVTFNLPFSRIDTAALRLEPKDPQGHGDIALTLSAGNRIAYLHLWPHARPWQLKHPQPLMRALPDAARLATLLGQAMAARAAGQGFEAPRPVAAAAAPATPASAVAPSQPLANAA